MPHWTAPSSWRRIVTLDLHVAGEPLRIIVEGVPPPPGTTMLEKRRVADRTLDAIRRVLMWEPRGHPDMYGALLTPPVTPDGDVGVLFLHNAGWSTMCGHGIIGLVTAAVHADIFLFHHGPQDIRIDTPAGRVLARWTGSQVVFRNVPSFVVGLHRKVEVDGLGMVTYDLAFGGAFYAYVDAASVDIDLTTTHVNRLIDCGMRISGAVQSAGAPVHPGGERDLEFLYGTIFTGPPMGAECHSRQVCVFADGEVDRSPTGTGVSGLAAILSARNQLGWGVWIEIEGILGTTFQVRAVDATTVGSAPAIATQVKGSAYITGRHEFFIDPTDPLADGFLLRL